MLNIISPTAQFRKQICQISDRTKYDVRLYLLKMNNHSPYRCVIVDDDPNFLFLLSSYIKEVPKLHLYGKYHDSRTAIDSITEEDKVDFLFLDVQMGSVSGLDIARHLRDKVKYIVFISVSDKYALEALQLGGDHYLVKPLTFQKFLETVIGVLKEYRHSQTKISSTNTR